MFTVVIESFENLRHLVRARLLSSEFHDLKNVVKEHGEEAAIIENKRKLTFKELSDMVDMIADSFPDNTHAVGIVMRHRTEMIASILAVLKTGARDTI